MQEDQESKVILGNSDFEDSPGNVQTYCHLPGSHLSLKQFRTHHVALWPPKELQTLKRLATPQQPSNSFPSSSIIPGSARHIITAGGMLAAEPKAEAKGSQAALWLGRTGHTWGPHKDHFPTVAQPIPEPFLSQELSIRSRLGSQFQGWSRGPIHAFLLLDTEEKLNMPLTSVSPDLNLLPLQGLPHST